MKKVFALVLAIVMTLTLVSCGKKEKTDAEYIEVMGRKVDRKMLELLRQK